MIRSLASLCWAPNPDWAGLWLAAAHAHLAPERPGAGFTPNQRAQVGTKVTHTSWLHLKLFAVAEAVHEAKNKTSHNRAHLGME
jgi:hypothetical protein